MSKQCIFHQFKLRSRDGLSVESQENPAQAVPALPPASVHPEASKKARICVVAGVEYEHEDDQNYTSFISDELDSLEEFDFGLTSDDGDERASEHVLVQQLIFPYRARATAEHRSVEAPGCHCNGSGNSPLEADGCPSPS